MVLAPSMGLRLIRVALGAAAGFHTFATDITC